jgi:hypothetical protein
MDKEDKTRQLIQADMVLISIYRVSGGMKGNGTKKKKNILGDLLCLN